MFSKPFAIKMSNFNFWINLTVLVRKLLSNASVINYSYNAMIMNVLKYTICLPITMKNTIISNHFVVMESCGIPPLPG